MQIDLHFAQQALKTVAPDYMTILSTPNDVQCASSLQVCTVSDGTIWKTRHLTWCCVGSYVRTGVINLLAISIDSCAHCTAVECCSGSPRVECFVRWRKEGVKESISPRGISVSEHLKLLSHRFSFSASCCLLFTDFPPGR